MLLHSRRSSPYEPGNKKTSCKAVDIFYRGGDKYDPTKQHYRCQKQRTPELKCPGTATTKEVDGQMLIIIQLLQSATHSTNLSCSPFHRWHIQGCWQPFQTYLYPMQGPDGGSIPCAFGPYTAGSTGCSGRLSGSSTGQTLPPKLW